MSDRNATVPPHWLHTNDGDSDDGQQEKQEVLLLVCIVLPVMLCCLVTAFELYTFKRRRRMQLVSMVEAEEDNQRRKDVIAKSLDFRTITAEDLSNHAPSASGEPHEASAGSDAGEEQSSNSEEHDHELECAICLDYFKLGQLICESTACRHFFHADCAQSWLLKSSNCPVCRTMYLKEQV